MRHALGLPLPDATFEMWARHFCFELEPLFIDAALKAKLEPHALVMTRTEFDTWLRSQPLEYGDAYQPWSVKGDFVALLTPAEFTLLEASLRLELNAAQLRLKRGLSFPTTLATKVRRAAAVSRARRYRRFVFAAPRRLGCATANRAVRLARVVRDARRSRLSLPHAAREPSSASSARVGRLVAAQRPELLRHSAQLQLEQSHARAKHRPTVVANPYARAHTDRSRMHGASLQ